MLGISTKQPNKASMLSLCNQYASDLALPEDLSLNPRENWTPEPGENVCPADPGEMGWVSEVEKRLCWPILRLALLKRFTPFR